MKVAFEELVQAVADHGETWGVTMADICEVGIDRVLDGISMQCNARGVESYSAEQVMADYFCDGAFSWEYDLLYF